MDASAAACPAAAGPCESPAVKGPQLFVNDDSCGDWLVPLANGYELQGLNALSALSFVVAGAPLVWGAKTPIARAYGLMMCGVGVGSCSFHATTSLAGFLVDICPMAVTAALMLYRAVHAVQADHGSSVGERAETTRMLICMAAAFVAVYLPWSLIVTGASHFTVWWVWAFLFGSMGTVFGVVALMVFANEGMLCGPSGVDIATAIACVLVGLGFTVHSFIPGMCDGWRTGFPFHAMWHFFSAVTANRCGRVLDTLTKLVEEMETAPQKKRKSKSLLVRLMQRELLPSQFSM
jgi:hypothetical protein